ncbi:MAG: arsenate reductase ArsC [Candidatus Andersenbacteria bacterium]
MQKVIFICAENAGRSQMAEAFFNTLSGNSGFTAESAGTTPASTINPVAIEVMGEKGMDISSQFPKQFDPDTAGEYERLISFGCLVKSAFSPAVQERIEDWIVEDPKDKELEEVRTIRDDIERRVKALLADLGE